MTILNINAVESSNLHPTQFSELLLKPTECWVYPEKMWGGSLAFHCTC